MASKIKIKTSTVATRVPAVEDLDIGELAINTADKKLYSKHSDNTIFEVGFDTVNNYLPLAGDTMTGGILNLTSLNPLTTLAESWIGPSSTTGIYFKGNNVGIGTTNPGEKLEIATLALPQPSFADIKYNLTGPGSWNWKLGGNGVKFRLLSNGVEKFTVDYIGKVGIGTIAPSELLDIKGGNFIIHEVGGLSVARIGNASGGDFSLYNSGGSVTVYIAGNSNNSYFNNGKNVGIGTMIPITPLHVEAILTLPGTSNHIATFGRSGSQVSAVIGYDETNTRMYLGTNTGHNLAIRTNNIDNILIEASTGNVLINTTTDNTVDKLQVNGSASFTSTIQATTAKLTNLTDGYIPYHISDISGLSNSPIYTEGTNVGIGTTLPSQKLEVNSSTEIKGYFHGTHGGSQGIRVQRDFGDSVDLMANYTGWGGGLASSSALRFSVNGAGINGTPAMYINTIGNVGIGTTLPTATLHLKAGTATAGTAPLKFTAGPYMTVPEAGTIQYNTGEFKITDKIVVTGEDSYISGFDFLKYSASSFAIAAGAIEVNFDEGAAKVIFNSSIDTPACYINGVDISTIYARKSIENAYTQQQYFEIATLTYATTINWNCRTAQKAKVTLTGNASIANPTLVKDGATYTLRITQDSVGGRTLTWGANFNWGDASAPVLSITPYKTDILSFEGDGTNLLFLGIRKGF